MDIESDRRTLHAVLSEIGWADPQAAPAELHVVELAPAAPPVRDVSVALDDKSAALVVRVRFLPPRARRFIQPVFEVLSRTNEHLGETRAFGIDDLDGSVFFLHTLRIGDRPLAAKDVRRTVLSALETVSKHAFEIAQAATGRAPGFAA